MEAKCNNFVSNAWKKDLCVNCQRHETDHRQRLQDGSSINKVSWILLVLAKVVPTPAAKSH